MAVDLPRLRGYRLGFIVGVPLGWAVLLSFHPVFDVDDIYGDLRNQVDRWLVVHVGTLFFIGLLGAALYLLVRDLVGLWASVSRLGAGVFVLFYGAGEAILGIAAGVVVQHADDLPAAERVGAADAVQAIWHTFLSADLLQTIGAVGWIVAVLAAAVAFRHVGAPLAVSIVLALSAIVILHGPPIGPIGLLFFVAAVAVLVRWQRTSAMATEPGQSST